MTHTLEFTTLPSAVTGFLRAAAARGSGLRPGQSIPRITATCRGVVADAGALRKYRKLCGFRIDGHLPASYPHVLAAPLHLQVLTHKAFPFKLLGAVHVRNAVTQHRAIAASEALDVEVYVEGQRAVDAGTEFDLVTTIRDTAGAVVWESTSTNLIRGRSGAKSKKSGWTPPDWSQYRRVESWAMPADVGRRYGLAAGDVNPIHLHTLTAKPFGFPRAIAHGMYSYARCVARLIPADAAAVSLTVAFKRPVLLPSRVELLAQEDAQGQAYLLTNAARDTVYLEGRIDRAVGTTQPAAPQTVAPEPGTKHPAAKKAAGGGRAVKKAGAKKAAAKKSVAKKTAAKKATAKKATAKKAAVKKRAGRVAAKKATAKKSSS